jgi:peroxiredoxin
MATMPAPPPPLPGSRARTVLGLAVVLALVVAAWVIGGRQGFDRIGQGGVNSRLLPRVGEVAPELAALDASGNPVLLSGFRGKAVWLNFWGSWCPPCRSEMPEMQAAWEQLAPSGMVLLAVSLDEPLEDAVRYAELNGATYAVAADPFRRGTAAYAVANFPTHILIGPDGVVRDVVLAELDRDQIVERARAAFGPSGGGAE